MNVLRVNADTGEIISESDGSLEEIIKETERILINVEQIRSEYFGVYKQQQQQRQLLIDLIRSMYHN